MSALHVVVINEHVPALNQKNKRQLLLATKQNKSIWQYATQNDCVFLLCLYAIKKKKISSYENLTVKEWWLIQNKMASHDFVYARNYRLVFWRKNGLKMLYWW